jgi:uncharacterized glyoxalase superfamily protein PhnB
MTDTDPSVARGGTDAAVVVWPTLRARDARGLVRFLVDAFGFEEALVVADGDRVAHAELHWPAGGGVMLGSAGPADDGARGDGDPWALRPGTAGVYVVSEDPDALFARAVAAGAVVVAAPHDTGHGSREVVVRDPEGNHWSFGTYRGEPRRA